MISTIKSFRLVGIQSVSVTIEVSVTEGLGIHLVGLADAAVKESLLRVVTALQALGYRIPGKKIVINIAPADLRKSGSAYDLPIALVLLSASSQELLPDIDKYVVAGELALDGTVREVPGWIQAAETAASQGKACILPRKCAKAAAGVLENRVSIYGVDTLVQTIGILNDGAPSYTAYDEFLEESGDISKDCCKGFWDSLKGHESEKRALEIAAAGGHPVFMLGTPGSGKSSLAKALYDILPPVTIEENLEIQRIYSAASLYLPSGVKPFRAPHYSSSVSAMLGGGTGDDVKPGETALSHNGILYIDEMAEMPKSVAEALRGPLEDGYVTIPRLKFKVQFPTRFHLVASSNPCPCGYYGEGDRCSCSTKMRHTYLGHLSGPILDRLTIQIWTHTENNPDSAAAGESSETVLERVMTAREIQQRRYEYEDYSTNDEVPSKDLDKYCTLNDASCRKFIEEATARLGLSARSYSRVLRIARTIADLEGSEKIQTCHLAEAVSYRFLDRVPDTE